MYDEDNVDLEEQLYLQEVQEELDAANQKNIRLKIELEQEKLREKDLEVFDTTTKYETNLAHRGEGIANWTAEHNISAKDFIVLDDEIFDDYEDYNILPRLIKSKWYDKDTNNGGLNEGLVKKAIELLNN